MIASLAALVNPYGRQAWLQPVSVAFGQILVVLAILLPEWVTIWNGVKSLLVAGGVTLLMHCVRDPGKKLERKLFEQWGGTPSIAMLRHSNSSLPATTKARYRDYLSGSIPGLRGLTPQRESEDPDAADRIYESAGAWLRAQTRDRTRFGLLLQENSGYGFRRNTLALAKWAMWIDVVALALLAGWSLCIVVARLEQGAEILFVHPVRMAVSGVVIAIHLSVFRFGIGEAWVRESATRYARQLLEACDTLEREERLRDGKVTEGSGKGRAANGSAEA